MATATIPVTVSDEAAARIAELGMQNEFEQMVEYSKQNVPGLRFIEVTLEYDGEFVDREPMIVINCHRPDPGPVRDKTDWNWGGWFVQAFPAEVCMQFVMLSYYEAADGR